jgi:hypothetical protein
MKLDRSEVKISLVEQEAQVALAYLGQIGTFKLLSGQVIEKSRLKGMARVHISNYRPGAQADEIEGILRTEAPQLFVYELPYDHRAPLLGAYVLGAARHEPNRADVLDGLSDDQVVSVSEAARDALLELH